MLDGVSQTPRLLQCMDSAVNATHEVFTHPARADCSRQRQDKTIVPNSTA